MSLLSVKDVSIAFGGIKAVDHVSLDVEKGQIYSIIGPNGAGKTTLFNLISGVYKTQSGSIMLDGHFVTGLRTYDLARRGMSRTFQNLQIFTRMTALENVMTGRHLHEEHGLLGHLLHLPTTVAQERRTRSAALACLDRVGLVDRANDLAGSLSYGAMKRLEIARALATEPKILLLDEPAAGCNATETEEIDHLLVEIARGGLSIVLIEHDMKLVMGISDRILVLEQGKYLVEGLPHEISRDPRVIKAYLGSEAPAVLGEAHA
jgi:branched-chain amino acid transport system ATP-binding protein